MDWTQLQTLGLQSPESTVLEKLEGCSLLSLRGVRFWGHCTNNTAILRFLNHTSSPVESLGLVGIGLSSLNDTVTAIIEHHCSTLHTLTLRHNNPTHRSYSGRYSPRDLETSRSPSISFLNTTHLDLLRDNIANLASLAIDIRIPDEWDYDLLDAITSFPVLEDLTLRFEPEGEAVEMLKEDRQIWSYEGYGTEGDADLGRVENRMATMIAVASYLRQQRLGKSSRGWRCGWRMRRWRC